MIPDEPTQTSPEPESSGEVPVNPPDETTPDSEETTPTETTLIFEPPPGSEAPPRIVAEMPLGGRSKPLIPAPFEPRSATPAPSEPEPVPAEPSEPEAPAPAEVEPVAAASPDDLEKLAAAETLMFSRAEIEQTPTLPDGVLTVDEVRRIAPETPVSTVRAGESPAQPASPPAGWDDEISPELATVLFGANEIREQARSQAAPAAARPAAPARVEPPAAPEIAAQAITLTDTAEARRLPLVAEGHGAPAPDVVLTGPARYVRIEEPLSDNRGQSTTETWDYLKPNYPSVGGRLVRRVKVQEYAYADGSWHWQYDREYADGGRDRREVRAAADRSYIERKDEVSTRDAETNKRQQFKEQAALILAEPEHEEKRGLLSSLFGRGDDDTPSGPKVWRPASGSEAKHARKQGGQAF
jgi:hypothetical protein